jgi:hypothetical protein
LAIAECRLTIDIADLRLKICGVARTDRRKIGHRRSAIGNQQSAIANRQSSIVNRQSAIALYGAL